MADTRENRRPRKARAIWIGGGSIAVVAIALAITFAVVHQNGNSQPSDVAHGNVRPQSNVLVSDQCATTNDEGLYEPATIQLTCGDGTIVANDVSWSQWGSRTAVGQGSVNEVSCVPNCAQGKDVAYKVNLTLSEPVKAEDGKDYFTRIAVSFIGTGPSGSSSQLFKDCSDSPAAPYTPRCPADEQGAN